MIDFSHRAECVTRGGDDSAIGEMEGTYFAFELDLLFVVVRGVPFCQAGFTSGVDGSAYGIQRDWDWRTAGFGLG